MGKPMYGRSRIALLLHLAWPADATLRGGGDEDLISVEALKGKVHGWLAKTDVSKKLDLKKYQEIHQWRGKGGGIQNFDLNDHLERSLAVKFKKHMEPVWKERAGEGEMDGKEMENWKKTFSNWVESPKHGGRELAALEKQLKKQLQSENEVEQAEDKDVQDTDGEDPSSGKEQSDGDMEANEEVQVYSENYQQSELHAKQPESLKVANDQAEDPVVQQEKSTDYQQSEPELRAENQRESLKKLQASEKESEEDLQESKDEVKLNPYKEKAKKLQAKAYEHKEALAGLALLPIAVGLGYKGYKGLKKAYQTAKANGGVMETVKTWWATGGPPAEKSSSRKSDARQSNFPQEGNNSDGVH